MAVPMLLLFRRRAGSAPAPPNPFEEDFAAYLGEAGLAVYPDHIPQGIDPPAAVYSLVGEDPFYTLKSAAGLTAREYQLSFFSPLKSEVIAMERTARAVLHGFRGMMGTTMVSSCRLQNVMDLPYEPNVDASDDGTFHRMAEYRILLRESIPNFS